eukprot:Tbor_TRINITY_DN3264_c0_g2::TRINITY_DN3264_c0_g2_i1::g.23742::m.23742/K10686/UBE1C, UBA3; ubiquitin-activating enzyme E1 C
MSFIAIDRLASRVSARYSKETHTEPICAADWANCSVLLVGAGGIGCEVLHLLALSGFKKIDVIDLDTVDLTNLNRQFLFREEDIGKPKATAAVNRILSNFPGYDITAHFGKVQDKPPNFFQQFDFVLIGVDSIEARVWMNRMIASLQMWTYEDGKYIANDGYPIPIIDGGSEGLMGNIRLILHGTSSCTECYDLFSKSKVVPMCTLESVPRSTEHCILYVKQKTWEDKWPFGPSVGIDGDDLNHVDWIMQHAKERQEKFNIPGIIDISFTQGIIKNSIPTIGFTNAMVGGLMVNEMIKYISGIAKQGPHFTFFNGRHDFVMNSTDIALESPCSVCHPQRHLYIKDKLDSISLAEVLSMIHEHPDFIKLGVEKDKESNSLRMNPYGLKVVMHVYLNTETVVTSSSSDADLSKCLTEGEKRNGWTQSAECTTLYLELITSEVKVSMPFKFAIL